MTPLAERPTKQDIIEQLNWDDSVHAEDIFVDVQNGVVTLKGKVPNLASKMAAEMDARQVNGVVKVDNYIQIEFPPRVTIPSDNEIINNIREMLNLDNRIKSQENISIESDHGIVTLSGMVSSFWEKYLVENITYTARGVVNVKNKLSVSIAQSVLDADIENDIRNALSRNILVDEDKLEVSVTDGVVKLTGVVANYLIKKEAYNIAMYSRGVIDVIDEISIG
jgi:osmotically-inducible protein OsmY